MMMVYDSVLPSHSIPTLVGLFAMILLVYVFQGLFDQLRQRMLGDIGSALDRDLSPRVQRMMSEVSMRRAAGGGDGLTPMRDLDAVRSWLSSAGSTALIDLPWIIFFILALCLLHAYLALTALAGAMVLAVLTFLTERATPRADQGHG
jgi:ATP-binding cassette subfamily C protein